MGARQFISDYRWPMIVVGLIVMSITAQGVLVFVATRSDAPAPLDDYYGRSLDWDTDAAVLEESRRLGWKVAIDIPSGTQYAVSDLRPVDLVIRDRAAAPVSGLRGRLIAQRPSDNRLDSQSELTELPHAPGHYRTLARLSAQGLWQLSLDVNLGEVRFVHSERVTLAAEASP